MSQVWRVCEESEENMHIYDMYICMFSSGQMSTCDTSPRTVTWTFCPGKRVSNFLTLWCIHPQLPSNSEGLNLHFNGVEWYDSRARYASPSCFRRFFTVWMACSASLLAAALRVTLQATSHMVKQSQHRLQKNIGVHYQIPQPPGFCTWRISPYIVWSMTSSDVVQSSRATSIK